MRLVTMEGEALLAGLDDWGIKELRKHQLIWRSWGNSRVLATDDFHRIDATHGVRRVPIEPIQMRRFLLSLLWRAAETSLPEFAEVDLPAADVERMRKCVRDGLDECTQFYPITLTQLSSRGPRHNMPPIRDTLMVPDLLNGGSFPAPIFRFYFDGLIVHFHDRPPEGRDPIDGPMRLGHSPDLMIPTIGYASSWHHGNLQAVVKESEDFFPGQIERVLGGAADT